MREIVTGMYIDWGVSIRKACGAVCFDTSTYHYKSRRTDQAAVERRIKVTLAPTSLQRLGESVG